MKKKKTFTLNKLGVMIQKLDAKIDNRVDGLEAKFSTKIDGVDKKVDGLEAKMNLRFNDFEKRIDHKIDQKIDQKMDQKFGEFEVRIDQKFEDFAVTVNRSFDTVQGQISGAQGQIASIHEQLNDHGNRLKNLETGQERMERKLDNGIQRFEYEKLDRRVSVIEKKVGISQARA